MKISERKADRGKSDLLSGRLPAGTEVTVSNDVRSYYVQYWDTAVVIMIS